MSLQHRDHFYCTEHKPPTPEGFRAGPNISHTKCEAMGCKERAEYVIFPKPLVYPRLNNA